VTKIIWGVDIPYASQKIDWELTDNKARSIIYDGTNAVRPIYVPCIRTHKQMFFELCDICGNRVPPGRVSRGITTCCPKCNAKKWDAKNGLVIEKERNANGVRPTSFWQTISGECFKRDNHTCQSCKKTSKELLLLQQTEHWFDPVYTKTDVGGYWHGTKKNPNYKYTDYVLNCHHIKPIKEGGNNKPENLITLCGKCHKIEHSHVKNVAKLHRVLEV
jgi:5-methylcytosine-specific restriction endonuclease McrA